MSKDHNVLPRRVIRVSKINLYMLSADIVQTALVAVRFRSCRTHSASVIDEAVAEVVAFFRRDDLPESHLNLFRIFFRFFQIFWKIKKSRTWVEETQVRLCFFFQNSADLILMFCGFLGRKCVFFVFSYYFIFAIYNKNLGFNLFHEDDQTTQFLWLLSSFTNVLSVCFSLTSFPLSRFRFLHPTS